MRDPNETELPFVGKKMSLYVEGDKRVDVVIHTDGTRDISFVPAGAEVPAYVARLDPATACALGALLCAAVRPAGSD